MDDNEITIVVLINTVTFMFGIFTGFGICLKFNHNLPKLNKNAKPDVELGLQTILIKPDEDSDLICPVAKTPFVSRSTFIDVLNSQQCLSSNPLSSTLAIDVGFDYSWNIINAFEV